MIDSVLFPPPGPSGLVQNSKSTSASTSQYPQVASDSDSEEDECFVSKLIPPSRLQPPSVTKGTCSNQRRPLCSDDCWLTTMIDSSIGKGKTPVRRGNNPPGSADQNVAAAAALERSCEKSCQVSSEQIKADMKAAAEKKRCSGKEAASRPATGKTTAGPEGNVHGTHPTTPGDNVAPSCVGASRQPLASRRQSPGTEDLCKARTRGSLQRTTAADGDSQGCGRTATSGSGETESSEPPSQQRAPSYFVPRRPLTRSCTRLSSVSLLPETGKQNTLITALLLRLTLKCV